MPWIRLNGVTAHVRMQKRPVKRCKCGNPSTRLCDWKISKTKTCDTKLCNHCTFSPAPDKDLCPKHRNEWATHPKNQELQLG